MKVTFQTCCGVDVHKSFLVATIIKTTGGGGGANLPIKRKGFPPSTILSLSSSNGFSTMTAGIFVWNLPVNTGSPSLIFLKMI